MLDFVAHALLVGVPDQSSLDYKWLSPLPLPGDARR